MNGIKNKDLKKRILEISYKKGLSHIGSCLTAVDIINEIYSIKKPDEKFVLSAGHAHLAHVVVREKYIRIENNKHPEQKKYEDPDLAEHLIQVYGIHCDRKAGCDVSTGSLGHGLGIAVGMALADRSKNVYCLISDGECAEGSIWEALRIVTEQKLWNLQIYMNFNGYGAYKTIDHIFLNKDHPLIGIRQTNMDGWPSFLQGQMAHYKVLNEKEYKECLEVVK